MLISQQSLILFDLTQLVVRSGIATPTGIGRVELAYARYLLEHHRDRTKFILAFPPKAQVIPTPVAARFIASVEMAWERTEFSLRSTIADRLKKFLGENPCVAAERDGSLTMFARGSKRRLLIGAGVMMRTVVESVRPRNLMAFSKSARDMTYICVSGARGVSPWISRWLSESANISGVFLVHDLIPVTHPEYSSLKAAERHKRHVRTLLKSASAIIANSQFTADSLVEFAGQEGLSVPQTIVAGLGIGDSFAKRPHPVEMPPYFVFVGTIEPRKNHILLLQVWQRLVMQHGSAAPKLILVGRRGWENENILDLLDRGGNLYRHVLECNQMCDDVLIHLITNSRGLLLPSHVEGYGLPVAEALSLGTPVICSNLAPLREIAGDIPEYVDPLAGRGWARTIMDYADLDNPRRKAQLERMKRFRSPTWNEHFASIEKARPEIGFGERNSPIISPSEPVAETLEVTSPVN